MKKKYLIIGAVVVVLLGYGLLANNTAQKNLIECFTQRNFLKEIYYHCRRKDSLV